MRISNVSEYNIAGSEALKEKKAWSAYRKPAEGFFGADEVSSVTILHGGLPHLLDICFSAGLQGMGYRSDHLPVPSNEALACGREYCDAGLCNPTYYTVGNLILYLEALRKEGKSRKEIVKNYILLTAGSCGPCRFGMYESQYRMALKAAGYEGFRVLVFNVERVPEALYEEPGLRIDLEFFTTLLQSIFIADQLNDLMYLTQPYEVKKGATKEAMKKVQELVKAHFEHNIIWNKTPFPVFPGYFAGGVWESAYRFLRMHYHAGLRDTLMECRKLFEAIEVDYTAIKPLVKPTGEFWAQSTEGDGNYRLFEFLDEQGCELRYEPVSGLVFYILYNEKMKYMFKPLTLAAERRKGFWRGVKYSAKVSLSRLGFLAAYQLARRLTAWNYKRINKFLGNRSEDLDKIAKLAEDAGPYMDIRFEGGEAFMEVGKNIYHTEKKKAHMVVSVKPFGCMPSTISDSVQARVVSDYDDMSFLPLETSGDGKINALSRVQMTLGEARQKATDEFHRVLGEYNITHEQFLEIHRQHQISYHGAQKLPWVEGYTLRVSHYMHQLMKKAGIRKQRGAVFG